MPRTIWDELVDNRDPADARRIAILDRLGILEAGAERAFDDVVQLAGRLFGVHNAAVTFVTGDRIVMKALRGHGVRSSPRERSFSNLVIERDDALVIEDALQDERVAASAVVTGDPHVRFFAGVPIYSGGERLGALALFDPQPRSISADDLEILRTLARHVDRLLELRWFRALTVEPSQQQVDELAGQVHSLADFDRVLNHRAHPAWILDTVTGQILAVNDSAVETYGWSRDELLTKTLEDIRPAADRSAIRALLATRSFEAGSRRRWRHVRANGTEFTVQAQSAPVPIEGTEWRLAVMTDLSTRLYGRSALVHAATHDALTGLANRAAFLEQLNHHLDHRDGFTSVLLLDIDAFKHVNATAGHASADQLLASVGARLVCDVRATDAVARVGGDEFAVLCRHTDEHEALALARRLTELLRRPCLVDGREYHLTVSIGVAVSSGGCADGERLLGDAELALRSARRAGLSQIGVFDATLRREAMDQAQTVQELQRALQRAEFVVHYQPIVDLLGSDVHLEALVRWQHPERGLLAPAAFLDIATEAGLLSRIGSLVLREVAAMAVRMRADGMPTRVAFNLPAAQLNESFVMELLGVAGETGLDPSQLIVEVTESAFAQNATAAPAARRLRRLGVGMSIDDFGTGYSSIDRLRTLEVDALKLDRSFVAQVLTVQGRSLAGAVLHLAEAIGVPVVAEGVETMDELEVVRELGCRYVQGYLLARPMPEADVRAALRRGFDICVD